MTVAFHRRFEAGFTTEQRRAAMLAARPLEQEAMAGAWRERMRLFALQRQLAEYGMPALRTLLDSSVSAKAWASATKLVAEQGENIDQLVAAAATNVEAWQAHAKRCSGCEACRPTTIEADET